MKYYPKKDSNFEYFKYDCVKKLDRFINRWLLFWKRKRYDKQRAAELALAKIIFGDKD